MPRQKKRASPAIGHNGDLPSHQDWLKALAIEVLYQEQKKLLRELHKRARKGLEGNGITLADLDALYKRRDEEPEEIEKWFRRLFNAFGAVHTEITQYDFFTVKADGAQKAAHSMNGQMAALAGEPCQPPSGLVGEPLQEWMNGWHEGEKIRKDASKTLADTLAAALADVEAGKVVDGTGNKPGTLSDHEAAGLKVVERAEGKPKRTRTRGEKKAAVRLVAGKDVPETDPEDQSGFADDGDNPLLVGGVLYETLEGADEARLALAVAREPEAVL